MDTDFDTKLAPPKISDGPAHNNIVLKGMQEPQRKLNVVGVVPVPSILQRIITITKELNGDSNLNGKA